MINWIKTTIFNWLGLYTLMTRISALEAENEALKQELIAIDRINADTDRIIRSICSKIETSNKDIRYINKEITEINSTLKATINVGLNLEPRSNVMSDVSWAVIAINGQKEDIMQFYHLGSADAMMIRDFLKPFSRSNKTYDVPYNMRRIFR